MEGEKRGRAWRAKGTEHLGGRKRYTGIEEKTERRDSGKEDEKAQKRREKKKSNDEKGGKE